MDREKIFIKLIELLKKKYMIPESILISKNYEEPLTGKIFSFDGISLIYLFFDIQNEFNLYINAEQILNYEFNTINGIVELIGKYINQEVA